MSGFKRFYTICSESRSRRVSYPYERSKTKELEVDTPEQTRSTTQTIAEQHIDTIQSWINRAERRDDDDLWNDCIGRLSGIDDEAQERLDPEGAHAVYFTDGSAIWYSTGEPEWIDVERTMGSVA
jgi:hypothetical protein